MKVNKAVIPCAGRGTRMAPFSNLIPKELLPLNCKPAIWYAISECISCGINQICIIISRDKKIIIKYLKSTFKDIKFVFIYQKKIGGLGQAVGLARKWVGDDAFILMNPDNFFGSYEPTKKLIKSYKGLTLLSLFRDNDEALSKYSVAEFADYQNMSGVKQIMKIIEKPTPKETKSRIFGYWRVIITPDIFDKIDSLTPGKNGEYQLTDAFAKLAEEKKLYGLLLDKNVKLIDIGNKIGYAEGNLFFSKNDI
ncbi:MAG: NTP transferase domain-containing protein [Mycoplasmataceae bacterium]|jgi:UTP--glucose-1-phosphate uridylyltransferase|nr:NTP transferase domain-containing protein [Mycoplasmataceae bacterium]